MGVEMSWERAVRGRIDVLPLLTLLLFGSLVGNFAPPLPVATNCLAGYLIIEMAVTLAQDDSRYCNEGQELELVKAKI